MENEFLFQFSSQNDTGAGLICNGVVKGIASVYECFHPTLPGVYIDVSQYKQWIDDISKKSIASITSSFTISTLLFVFVGLSKLREMLFN